jgi:hypothetical protein
MSTPADKKRDIKEPYRPPTLTVYGTIRDLTQAIGGTMGRNDMGAGIDKTGF